MYRDWFDNYHRGEVHLRAYLQAPEKLDSGERIAYYDKYAARLIAEAKELISNAQEYRQALAARYAELETMPYKRRLSLTRHKGYSSDSRVTYTVLIVREFEDGTTVEELKEVFSGSDRKAAFALYESLLKQYPGIPAEKHIEKSKWER